MEQCRLEASDGTRELRRVGDASEQPAGVFSYWQAANLEDYEVPK